MDTLSIGLESDQRVSHALEAMAQAFQDAPQAEPESLPERFEGVLIIEGEQTSDGREIALDALTWRELPIPLLLMNEEGHHGSDRIVGRIESIERQPVGSTAELRFSGSFDLDGEWGREGARLVAAQMLRWVSADIEIIEADIIEPDDPEEMPGMLLLEGRIMGATLVGFPAFPGAVIVPEGVEIGEETGNGREAAESNFGPSASVTDEDWDGSPSRYDDEQFQRASAACRGESDAPKTDCFLQHHEPDGRVNRNGVHAAAARFNQTEAPAEAKETARAHLAGHYTRDLDEEVPDVLQAEAIQAHAAEVVPASHFADPELEAPQRYITLTDDGRIYGHLATWRECHSGSPVGECITPEALRGSSGYPHFHIGVVETENGPISTGPIVLRGGHASTGSGTTIHAARSHYADTDSAVADVRLGEDAHGIWFSGALRPSASPEDVRVLRASGVSGDWRKVGESFELIAVCSVNTPGFPKVRAHVASGELTALVAAGGHPEPDPALECGCGASERVEALEARLEQLEAYRDESVIAALDERIGADEADEERLAELDARVNTRT